MQAAFDSVIDKVERQIKKQREKARNHKENASRQAGIESPGKTMEEDDDEDRARVVETRRVILQPMSLDEAVLALDRSKNPFFIYRDISSENVTVLYRRDDGQYVLIEPSR